MKRNTLFNFIIIFVMLGLCLVSTSHANSSSDFQAREEIIERTMSMLKAQEDLSRQPEVYVSEQSFESDHRLRPRFEANWRYSNNRSIMMGEFWLPIVQCKEDAVLFCDLRIMGDDSDNKEFNVGAGYREVLNDTILGNGIAGAMVWFDRRFTDRDFQFNQITLGGEWLGEQFDFRVNGYVPLDKKKTYTQTNPNGSGDGFVGNQILVNTDQVVVEEVLPGLDFEAGTQLNFMNTITDSTRLFLGGYHFEGDLAEDITGVRTRIVSDITSDVQLGVRFQHDDVRGSQTYFESTVRFPFGHKKKYKREGYWSRLDESPERDIDVVSNEAVTVAGTNITLLNATTNTIQNVIHVDNMAAVGGDGTVETPYNTLTAAESAASANTLIYIHKGDGTSASQNGGITLDDTGQMLVGSGVDLLYSEDRFKTSNGNNISGSIVKATTSPVITNAAGDGISITADNVFVAGLTVDGATSHGIKVLNADNVTIDNVTSNNNTSSGIQVNANATSLNQVTLTGNTINNNGAHGLYVELNNSGNITTVDFMNNSADMNGNVGLYAYALSGSAIDTVNFMGNTVTNNVNTGVRAEANGAGSTVSTANFSNNNVNGSTTGLFAYARFSGNLGAVNFMNNTSVSNTNYGLWAYAINDGDIGTVSFKDNTATSNVLDGLRTEVNGVGSTVTTVNFMGNKSDDNSSSGLRAYASNGGNIGTAHFTNNTADNNTLYGLYAYTLSGGDMGDVNFTNNTSTKNNYGLRAEADGVGSTITTISFMDNISNDNVATGFLGYAQNDGNLGTVNFVDNIANNNTDYGLWAYALSGGDIAETKFTNNMSMDNTRQGIIAFASGAGSTLTTIDFTNNTADSNDKTGIFAYANLDGDIGTANFTGNTSNNNSDYGLRAQANGAGSTINIVNYTNNVADNNMNAGLFVYANNSGSLTTATAINNTSSNSGGVGLYAYALAGGDIATVDFRENTVTSGALSGIDVLSNGVGSTITNVTLTDNTVTANARNGLYIHAISDGDIAQVKLQGNTSNTNSEYGIFINDDSAAGGIGADLGGGAFGSSGGNSVSGNTLEELLVDLDGGSLKAENNWWGSATGLAGAELLTQDASGADTTPFLTVDPE